MEYLKVPIKYYYKIMLKTEIIFKHKITFGLKVKLDGKRLVFQDCVNYLGFLMIDNQLNWSYHQKR